MSVADNEKQGSSEQNNRIDHVICMDTGEEGQTPHREPCIPQTNKNENQRLISLNRENISTITETSRTCVCSEKGFDKIQKQNGSKRSNRHICGKSSISICLSLLALGAVMYIYFKREESHLLETVTPVENIHGEVSKLQVSEQKDRKIFGRFVMDQQLFNNTGRQNVSWVPISNSNTAITLHAEGPCIVVPERGTYGIFSLITFSVAKHDSVSQLLHFIRLENEQEGEQFFQRKIFAVPTPDNRNSPEYIPTTFVSFSALKANGRICIDTSDKQYVFISSLDNTVNIFKVS